jgi:hypothetical protein
MASRTSRSRAPGAVPARAGRRRRARAKTRGHRPLFVEVLREKLHELAWAKLEAVQGRSIRTPSKAGHEERAKIKTHHNACRNPGYIDRPRRRTLRDLYKDEVACWAASWACRSRCSTAILPGPGSASGVVHDGSRPPSPCGMGESGWELPPAVFTSFQPDSPRRKAWGLESLRGRILP